MRITFSSRAKKALERLDKITKKRIKQGICSLPEGDVKRLQGSEELYRLRIGGWRVLFSYATTDIASDTILIEKISSRGEAYKEV